MSDSEGTRDEPLTLNRNRPVIRVRYSIPVSVQNQPQISNLALPSTSDLMARGGRVQGRGQVQAARVEAGDPVVGGPSVLGP